MQPIHQIEMSQIKMPVYRFDFSKCFIQELRTFSQMHQEDDRHMFKDAWNEWIKMPTIDLQIKEEIEKHTDQGFKGDILDKMFKSARYYYRKKKQCKPEPKSKPIKYMGFHKTFLKHIDEDILEQINENLVIETDDDIKNQENSKDQFSKPTMCILSQAEAYANFCQNNQTEILAEFIQLKNEHGELAPNISCKLKKAFKTRFFKIKQDLVSNIKTPQIV